MFLDGMFCVPSLMRFSNVILKMLQIIAKIFNESKQNLIHALNLCVHILLFDSIHNRILGWFIGMRSKYLPFEFN